MYLDLSFSCYGCCFCSSSSGGERLVHLVILVCIVSVYFFRHSRRSGMRTLDVFCHHLTDPTCALSCKTPWLGVKVSSSASESVSERELVSSVLECVVVRLSLYVFM